MRITQQAKAETRKRILDEARALFKARGFDNTTTRDVAKAAQIASGTLFNYFSTKEAIVMALVRDSFETALSDFDRRRDDAGSLNEKLFLLIAVELRRLKPHRKYFQTVLETALNPIVRDAGDDGAAIRQQHLDIVAALIEPAALANRLAPTALQLYWTLYTGVMAHWAHDSSRNQEATLALLDQSMSMFVNWLENQNDSNVEKELTHADNC